MKTEITNFNYKTGSYPLVEVHMQKVHLTSGEQQTALTEHVVSAVEIIEGVRTLHFLKKFNHLFDYQGGDAFQEAMDSLMDYFAEQP
jgi:hypothetical protein